MKCCERRPDQIRLPYFYFEVFSDIVGGFQRGIDRNIIDTKLLSTTQSYYDMRILQPPHHKPFVLAALSYPTYGVRLSTWRGEGGDFEEFAQLEGL